MIEKTDKPVCSRCQLPDWTHELWQCVPAHMGDFVCDDDMRREIVLRELNQGALAGLERRLTEYAADLVVAALNRFDEWAGKAVMHSWSCVACGQKYVNRLPVEGEAS